ncbi:replication factor A protein 2 [Serendipita sp. 407]|nr:replication factor A protein 2 [Serendipita sp. 407]
MKQISVVVHVHEVSMQTTADVYKVSDGSGQIEVRHWVESRSPDDMEADMEGSPLKGTYVKFVGMIRTFSDRKHINATLMRKVEDCNEVFFHFTEVMAVTMLNLHGPPGGSSYAGAAASSYSRQGGGEQVQYSHLPPLERAIYRFFVENPAPGDGYHVRQIMKAVKDLVAIEARNSDVDESTFFAYGEYVIICGL